MCLQEGRNFRTDFATALLASKLVVPLVSEASLQVPTCQDLYGTACMHMLLLRCRCWHQTAVLPQSTSHCFDAAA